VFGYRFNLKSEKQVAMYRRCTGYVPIRSNTSYANSSLASVFSFSSQRNPPEELRRNRELRQGTGCTRPELSLAHTTHQKIPGRYDDRPGFEDTGHRSRFRN